MFAMPLTPRESDRWKVRARGLQASARRFSPRDFVQRLGWLLTGARQRVVSLQPMGAVRGRVLFSFIIEPFLLPPGRVSHAHTHDWESLRMVQTFLDAGYAVDVTRWSNLSFEPVQHYDVFVDVRLNLERLAPKMPAHCRKVMHIETAHPSVHNAAQLKRLQELCERRGIDLAPFKLIEDNHAIEHADCATCLGNEFTVNSYAFADKPIHRIPISVPFTYPWPERKSLESVRRTWLWFGSEGFVHKGLDLVLEAFAGMPDFTLYVCGPMEREPEFQQAFYEELYRTPNIRTLGWVDVGGARFRDVANRSLGLIYPSCSEGGGGSVYTCMHAGLIPVVSRESSVDVDASYGCLLKDCRVETLRDEVRRFGDMSPADLKTMAERAWSFARAHHTREAFAEAYRNFVADLVRAS